MTTRCLARTLPAIAATAVATSAGAAPDPKILPKEDEVKKDAPPAPAAAPVASAPAQAKVYVVGTDAAYAPFESQYEKGEIVGFDIDMLKAVAAKAGIEVKFVNTPWEGIFNALAQGDRDIVVSAVTITDERKGTMDFSQPYFDAQQLIAVKEGSKVAKFDDLKKPKAGVQTGNTGDDAVTKLLRKTRVQRRNKK